MRRITLAMMACCALATVSYAQDVPVNREKYPDYADPQKAYPAEPRLMKFVPVEGEVQSRRAMRQVVADELPEYWNNADTKYFPPVFNQDGGSCGSASRICYMFTHEINALRDLDASLPENQYPSHFVWLLTNGNSGKDAFVEYVGVPNAAVYGGRTYSSLFGYQEETNNDFGWMTGYDKWMNAIGNRMLRPTSNPLTVDTEEGRLAAKAWLYNHAGDLDFKAGGLIGLGVASGGIWRNIPQTAANDAAGVTGMGYVHRWGTQVDHAVTMVGWDDRIEFDLDGNGVAGEVSKDEKGAWIIVNSWGNWENKGFIYCPYKYAGPVSDPETGAMKSGYWSGELYHARKNFRPLRVIKLKMDYSHRSELLLQVGISSDLNATEPEAVMDMHHFRYAGDGANGNADPVPAIPMLGRWKNVLNYDPMEFCYDLTDLSANFDTNKPLKYFFIVNRKNATSNGTGNIYEASIVDLEKDLNGIESMFDLGGSSYEITQDGQRLMISAVVYGKGYESVMNLMLDGSTLLWDAPKKSSYEVKSYKVYADGVLVGETTERTYAVGEANEYSVSAVYSDGTESAKVSIKSEVEGKNNDAVLVDGEGFTIPNVFVNKYNECTIEFLIKPTAVKNWNCEAGPGWGTYMQHFNSNGTFTCGWDTQNRITSSSAFPVNQWNHIAIVVSGNKMVLYRNGSPVGNISSKSYSGLGGFGDYVFSSSSHNNGAQNAQYDEIRIWNYARTQAQIRGQKIQSTTMQYPEYYGEVLPEGLVAYYKGDAFLGEDGAYYMRDCVAGNHARMTVASNPVVAAGNSSKIKVTKRTSTLAVREPKEDIFVGVPVAFSAERTDAINKIWWTIPSCGIMEKHILAPTVVFNTPGKHEIVVSGSNYADETVSDTIEVEVKEASALDASFTINSTTMPCGEQFSMHVNNYVDACSYEWTMHGANVEKVFGPKAGAIYEAAGTYTVTLKITSSDGRVAESSQVVMTTSVAPVADFMVNEMAVLKETPVMFTSTSRYGATEYEWTLEGDANKVTITEGQKEQWWTPKYPGRYDVTLKATNNVGSHSATKQNFLIVCNDDSKNGLNFSQDGAKVTIPYALSARAMTIDFWANPTSLSNYCMGMGESEETFLIKVNEVGAMYVSINGVTVQSANGYVQPGIWNHYAIRRNSSGKITFYRNNEKISEASGGATTSVKGMTKFMLGVDGIPMKASIDEFRIWTKDYMYLKNVCNVYPSDEEVAALVSGQKLVVYYDFNQNGGDVNDRTGNGNHGVRTGFGPDGDAWGLSKGVFSLYLDAKVANETITSVDEALQDGGQTAHLKGVYSVSGQYVGKTIVGLPAGVYIVDGKKVVVK